MLYAAADAGAASPVGAWLHAAGYRCVPVEGFGLAIGELMAHRAAFAMLIVDIDGFGQVLDINGTGAGIADRGQ